MALLTGDDGKILIGAAPLADVTSWSLETRAATKSYASSATGGFRRHAVGARQGKGRIQFLLDPADPITGDFDAGSQVTLLLYLDTTRFYSVPAVIESIRMHVEIDEGKLVGGDAEFTTDGAWTMPTY